MTLGGLFASLNSKQQSRTCFSLTFSWKVAGQRGSEGLLGILRPIVPPKKGRTAYLLGLYLGLAYNKITDKSSKMETKSSCVICLSELASLLEEIEEAAFSKCTVRLTIKKLNLEIKDLSSQEISALACRIEERARINQAKGIFQSGKGNWVFEEQKLFCSILPYFCLLRKITIDQMIHQDLQPLESVFISKSATLLFFEWKYLDSLTNCFRVEWTEEDVKNLKDLMRDYKESSSQQEGIVRWKRISLELLELSGCTKFHSPRDCRQLWINHINPHVSKGSWDAAEDLELFLKIREHGNKWALISKLMKGVRTEHMIKNRVNSFMKKMKIRAKTFKPAQIDAIIEDLQRKLAHQDFQTQKFEPEECLVKIEEEPQGEIPTSVDYDRPNVKREEYAVLYDVLDLTTDRIFVTQTDMPDSYQYSEDYSYIRPMEQDPIFEDLMNLEPNFYFYE